MCYQNWSRVAGCAIVSLTALQTAWAADATVGTCGPGTVEVCGTAYFTNTTGQTATDLHFYMYQNDRDEVHVVGAKVSAPDCGTATAALGTDNGQPGAPPPGDHGAQVDLDQCNIPAGHVVPITVCLCMNERNCLKFKDVKFTHDGTPVPPDPARPPPDKSGWRTERPYRGGDGGSHTYSGSGRGAQEGNGGSGNWVHRVCYENDSNDWLIIDELKLLASMTYYSTGSLNWSTVAPIIDPGHPYPICIPPGSRYCYDFQTTGSYVGGHIYQKWSVRVDTTGICPNAPIMSLLDADPPPPGPDDATQVVGDHPVEAVMTDCLDGEDSYLTTTPTEITFGSFTMPAIPPNFFGPGSDPFLGTVTFNGKPLDPHLSNTDTIVQRNAIAYLDDDGATTTIPIQLEALSLQSVEPIHVTYQGGQISQFDVPAGMNTMTWFNVPTAPTQTSITNTPEFALTGVLKQSIPSATNGAQMRLVARDGGGPPELWSVDSFFDIFFDVAPGFPSTRFFDVFLEVAPPSGTGTLPMTPPTLAYTPGNSFFDVFWGDIADTPNHTQHLQTHVDMSLTQPLTLGGVSLIPPDGNSRVRFNLTLTVNGPVTTLSPILTGHTTGSGISFADSFFDVFFDLDPSFHATGSMSLTRNDGMAGGTFTTQAQILPRVSFVRSGGGTELLLAGLTPYTIQQPLPHGWTYEPYPGAPSTGGPNFFATPEPLQWTDPSGSPHTVNGAIGIPHAVAWRSVHHHGLIGDPDFDLWIALDPAAAGSGPAGPTVETRSGGLQRVQVDFDQPMMLVPGPGMSLTGHITSGGVMGPLQNFNAAIISVNMIDTNTLEILMGGLPNQACYRIDLSSAVASMAGDPLGGDTDCSVRSLVGDVDGDGAVTAGDALGLKGQVLQQYPGTWPHDGWSAKYDLNLNATINLADALAAKARIGQQALCP